MVKTGFRGERKGNPHPNHILSYSETSPRERGNVVTEKGNPHPDHILSYSETSPKERGNVGTEKRISKLENSEISKVVEGV